MQTTLVEASSRDAGEVAELCALLWPDATVEEHRMEMQTILRTGMYGTLPMTIFLSRDEAGALQGFIQVGMRSHADGCDVAHPVGYIEGWYVRESVRKQGLGSALMRRAESWALERGCKEMASDAWIDHEDSQSAHLAAGFEIVDRCVHFRKTL